MAVYQVRLLEVAEAVKDESVRLFSGNLEPVEERDTARGLTTFSDLDVDRAAMPCGLAATSGKPREIAVSVARHLAALKRLKSLKISRYYPPGGSTLRK